jgi:Ca-activated chloride channel family protein
MTFLDPRWLWLLLAIPVLLLLEWNAAARVRRALEQLVGRGSGVSLLEQRRPGQRRLGWTLRACAVALLAVGAAGPEWGNELVRRSATGSDVVLAVDVSASMDVRDVAPSRLEEARREALAVLERLGGSKVGVVAFAGDAVRLCPLTLDRGAARMTLESLGSGSVSAPGSDLGKALRMAARALPGGRRSEQVIVLWSDGEDLEAQAESAIEELARAGIRVFAVGVGTPGGDVVPVLDEGGRAVDIKRDEAGTAVRSRLDERLLRTLARRTRGGYFSAARPGGELPRLLSALGGVARGARGEHLVERPVARFPLFAGLAALLIAYDIARARRRGAARAAKRSRVTEAARAGSIAAAFAFAALVPGPAAAQSDWAKGDRAMRGGQWAAADSLYARRAGRNGPPAVRVNRATARALAGKREEAEKMLAGLSGQPGAVGRMAGYNHGTMLAERGAYDEALAALRKVLEADPTDADARFNYELALRRKQRPQESQQQQPQQPEPRPGEPEGSQGGSGEQQEPPQPPQGSPSTSAPPPPRQGEGLTRAQAERLLGSLEELERLEQQRSNRVRVMRERRGKDW